MRVYGGRPAGARRADRRERLMEAGLDLLGAGGWHAVTVTAVCKRARLTPRYFYESFRGRDELLVAVFDTIVAEVAGRAAAPAPPADVRATVRRTIAAWVETVTEDPRKGRAAFVEALGSEALMRRRLAVMSGFADLLAEQLATRAEERTARVAGLAVSGALVETMVEWLEGRLEATPDQLVEDFTRVCTATLEAARS